MHLLVSGAEEFGSFPHFVPASILTFTSSIVSLSPLLLFAFILLII